MTEIKFGYKSGADRYREEYPEYICSDDDARLKTVTFTSDAPEWLLDQARLDADEGRTEVETDSVTASLTEGERERIREVGGFDGNVSHFNWQSAKGVFAREGMVQTFGEHIGKLARDYDDPIEGAEQEVERNKRGEGGAVGGIRDVGEERERAQASQQEAIKAQKSSECDHAADHCEHGDPEACEFLRNACGYDEEEVARILDEDTSADDDEITGKAAGALGRAWGGYKGAITRLDREVSDVVESKREAERAAAAINAIRRDHGQDPMEFERLEELSDQLEDLGAEAHDAEGHVELMERFS
jgi:hypothetical protein